MWIVLISVLVFGFAIFPAYKSIKAKIDAPIIEQRMKDYKIAQSYKHQNKVFGGPIEGYEMNEYIPYSEFDEKRLTIYINAYNYTKSQKLTLKEIEEFLKEATNSDGTPKTYLDASEIVKDFVDWCYNNQNGIISPYRDSINEV